MHWKILYSILPHTTTTFNVVVYGSVSHIHYSHYQTNHVYVRRYVFMCEYIYIYIYIYMSAEVFQAHSIAFVTMLTGLLYPTLAFNPTLFFLFSSLRHNHSLPHKEK